QVRTEPNRDLARERLVVPLARLDAPADAERVRRHRVAQSRDREPGLRVQRVDGYLLAAAQLAVEIAGRASAVRAERQPRRELQDARLERVARFGPLDRDRAGQDVPAGAAL